MHSVDQVLLQEANEIQYNKKHIDTKIRYAIDSNPVMDVKLAEGIKLIQEYVKGTYYESKMKRIAQLSNMSIKELVMEMFVGIAYFQLPELLSSAAAQIAARLKLSDKVEAITTVAELLAVLCQTDAFDITKDSKRSSMMTVSKIPLDTDLIAFIAGSEFLPPMVCMPKPLIHNYSSGYLTHNDSLMLGSGNHHDGDLCLDVLNTMNKIALSLDLEFLDQLQEPPTHELDTPEKLKQWDQFVKQSYHFYDLMENQGNKFYLNHKVDKRGRIYAHGYHISTEGTSFKKAMLNLTNKELVKGVP